MQSHACGSSPLPAEGRIVGLEAEPGGAAAAAAAVALAAAGALSVCANFGARWNVPCGLPAVGG